MLDAQGAQRLADLECAKHKRFAHMILKGDYWELNYTFDYAVVLWRDEGEPSDMKKSS